MSYLFVKKVVVGINSIQDTNPELINFIYNKDDALKYTSHSNKYIYFQCPDCKNLKKAAICNIVTNGFYCQFCNDNISYPNKFIRCFLQQLNVDFEVEKTFIWSNGKIYDQYIPELNAIIENHGRQHYLSTSQWKNNRDEQKNDKIKKEIAKNNVKYYIEIDCSVSSKEYIKNSLMKSELSSLFDLSQIDWDYCEQYALSNLLKKVCADWESYNDYYQLKQTYNLSVTTLRSYIHKGCEYGLCSKEYYAPLKSKVENSQDINAKPIFCKTDNIYFFSSRLCEEYYKKMILHSAGLT